MNENKRDHCLDLIFIKSFTFHKIFSPKNFIEELGRRQDSEPIFWMRKLIFHRHKLFGQANSDVEDYCHPSYLRG